MTGLAPGRLAQRVLAFVELAARAAGDDDRDDAWAALAAGVAIESFSYVGRAREILRWPEFTARIDLCVRAADIAITAQRVEQSDRLVFLQLGERRVEAEQVRHLTTMTIFEFDAHDSLCRIDSFQ